jgi:RNA polymerase sigma factor (sigma-70 family)
METLTIPTAPDRPMTFDAQTFSQHLPLIESVIAFVAARHHLSGHDAEDFGAAVLIRLLERDCAILRKFQGRSSLRTFLTVVIVRLYQDYRTANWGRWRPSAEARRLGPGAIRLERLMTRDGLTFDEAAETLRTSRSVTEGVEAMREWSARLPARLPGRRQRPRRVNPSDLAELSAAPVGTTPLPLPLPIPLLQTQAELAIGALRRAVLRISPEEQRLLTLIFANQFSVAQTARRCVMDQKKSYRRLARLLNRLRDDVQNAGITAADVGDWIGRPDIDTSSAAFLKPASEHD